MNIPIDEQIARQRAVIRHCEGKSGINIDGDKAILASLEKLAALESQPVPVEPETFKFAIDIDTPVAYVVLKDDYDTLRDYAVQMKAENEKWQERVFEFDTCIQEVADELGACCGGVDGDQADPLSTTQVLLKAICHIKQRAEKADLILIADKQKWDAEGKLAGIADTIAAVRRNINPFDDPQLDYLGDMREEIWEIQFSADRRKNERAEKAEAVNRRMVELLKRLVEWSEKYPSSRIYNESEIRAIAKQIDEISIESAELLKEATVGP